MSSRFMLAGLKEARERLNLSQCEAAQRCGVSSSAYHRWESGETNPSPKNAEKLADGLVCTVEQLMFGFRPDTSPEGSKAAPEMVTREEFEELRRQVELLAEGSGSDRPSIYHDARRIAESMGLVDSDGAPVWAGCMFAKTPSSPLRRVVSVSIEDPPGSLGSGMASVTCSLDDGSSLTAVDMRVKGFVVCGKRAER